MNRSLLAIAHRGYSSRFPENTPAAFAAACDLGAEALLLNDPALLLSRTE